jgi:hypothetical protein
MTQLNPIIHGSSPSQRRIWIVVNPRHCVSNAEPPASMLPPLKRWDGFNAADAG